MENQEQEQEYFLCKDCVVDNYLKGLVSKNSDSENTCAICLQKKKVANISSNQDVKDLSRFLIRYYYPEYEYNIHWGGDELPKLFYHENPIISNKFSNQSTREVEIEEFLMHLIDLWGFDNPIPIYWGHDDYGRGLFIESIKNEKAKLWVNFKKHLRQKNYYLIEDEAKKKLAPYFKELDFTVDTNIELVRARIGFKEEEKHLEHYARPIQIKVPYTNGEISAPPPLKATAGRANRHGVSYLYLASDIETAIGEVRPHPGHYISIGKFKPLENLKVVDLRAIDLLKYFKSGDNLEVFKLLRDLADELSIPILPEEKENYLVTQFISDIVRQLNYDGILFKSSVSDGYNFVAYNAEKFGYLPDSSRLIKVQKIEFDYKDVEFDFDGFIQKAIEK